MRTVPKPGQVLSPTIQYPGTPTLCGIAFWFVFRRVCLTPPTCAERPPGEPLVRPRRGDLADKAVPAESG